MVSPTSFPLLKAPHSMPAYRDSAAAGSPTSFPLLKAPHGMPAYRDSAAAVSPAWTARREERIIFQSTLPRRKWHALMELFNRKIDFNPHFREGSDSTGIEYQVFLQKISIHTSAKEVTANMHNIPNKYCFFLPNFNPFWLIMQPFLQIYLKKITPSSIFNHFFKCESPRQTMFTPHSHFIK